MKGFTLLELLIVIAVLAILATAIIITLDPMERLREARDSQRISDISCLKSAIVIYQSDVNNATITDSTCERGGGLTAICTSTTATSSDKGNFSGGDGWIGGLLFEGMSPTPLSKLPVDPVNNSTYYYFYAASSTNFEIDCKLESTKYSVTNNLDAKDGGDDDTRYEVGTDLTIL